MTKYIALLRGINVGGHRKIKMDDLAAMFTAIGFTEVATYIQSGNVVFSAPEQDERALAGKIRDQIEDTFGYEVPVIIRTASGLQEVWDHIPFEKKEGWKRYITFLSTRPEEAKQQKLEAQSNDIETFRMGNGVVYIQVDKQTDKKPVFSSNFIQKQLDIPATNRNLRTVRKLLELAQK